MTSSPRPAEDARADDAALLARHVDGDPDAFAVLVARHRDRLWAVAMRTLGDPDDAADALQDALLRAFRRAETFRGEAAVTTWLHRVVVNACLDQLRSRRSRPSDPVDPLEDSTLNQADRGLDRGAGDPEAAALAEERRRQVLAALATLPVDQRAALVLVDMQGWSVHDAAGVLDCPVGTVKSRCSRGRARLAPLLAPLNTGTPVMPPLGQARNPRPPGRVPPTGREGQPASDREANESKAGGHETTDDHETTGRAT